MVFLTFFHFSQNFTIRNSWSEPQSAPSVVLLTLWIFSTFGCKDYIQSDFNIHHLVMFMCSLFSCVVGQWCLLWSVYPLGKILLDFALLHFVLHDQICLLFQVFLDFLLFHSTLLWWKGHLFFFLFFFFLMLVLESLVGLHWTIQLQLLQH